MSKAVKQIVSVAAMIAIPYFAPMIAGSAALAGVSAAIGTTATSALVGAGLGAANASLTGGDVGRGALMGGIGGGIAGYTQPTGVAGGAAGGTGLTPPTAAAAAPGSQFALSGTGGQGLQFGTGSPGLAFGGQTAGTLGGAAAGAAAGTAGAPGLSGAFAPDYSLAFTAPTAAAGTAGTTAFAPDYSLAFTAPTAAAGTAAAGTAGAPQTYSEALKAKFTNPKNLADMTLRAAGQLAGSALAGSGLSPEEEALLGQQTEELRQLQQTNQALFNQRLEQAQNLMGESKYFDPEYFGLQSSRRAQTQGAVAKRAGLRGLTGERRESEARRFDIESGRRTGTAYDVGFQSAISPRLQTQQAGLAGMPGYMPYQTPAISGQLYAQGVARQRRAEDREGIADMFGPLYK